MTTNTIIQLVRGALEAIRPPAAYINGLLILCSMIKRPGLSVMISVAKIISALERRGINTNDMSDGRMNMVNVVVQETVSEIYRAIKEDMNTQVSLQQGSLMVTGTVNTPMGPFPVTSTNITTGHGYACSQ